MGTLELGANFGRIVTNDLSQQSMLTQGTYYCCATKRTGGFELTSHEQQCDHSVKVYWLPWIRFKVTEANRTDFEGDCEFFMTPKLEGCRFVLTQQKVLHIASDVHNASPTSQGSWRRTEAEEKITGKDTPSRRLSINTAFERIGHYKYEGTAYVFGMKFQGGWKYMALRQNRQTMEDSWIEFNNTWEAYH